MGKNSNGNRESRTKNKFKEDLLSFNDGNPLTEEQKILVEKSYDTICWLASHNVKFEPIYHRQSFKKDSMKRYFPLNYHLEHEEDVDKDGFTMDGTNIDVPCVFQIWIKKDYEREKPVKLEPKGFKFTKKLHGRYALRRVGVRAGLILDMFLHPLSDISEQSHYFIKLDEGDEKFIEKYKETINFEHNNTVGPKSISKQEFIQELNELF